MHSDRREGDREAQRKGAKERRDAQDRQLQYEREQRERGRKSGGTPVESGQSSESNSLPGCFLFIIPAFIVAYFFFIPSEQQEQDIKRLGPQDYVEKVWLTDWQIEEAITRYLWSRIQIPHEFRIKVAPSIAQAARSITIAISESGLPDEIKLGWFTLENKKPVLKVYRIPEGSRVAVSNYKTKLEGLFETINETVDPNLIAITEIWQSVRSGNPIQHSPEFFDQFSSDVSHHPRLLRTHAIISTNFALLNVYSTLDSKTKLEYRRLLPKSVLNHKVLRCKFHQPDPTTQTIRFYWHKTRPQALAAIEAELPTDHPVHQIRDAISVPPAFFDPELEKP